MRTLHRSSPIKGSIGRKGSLLLAAVLIPALACNLLQGASTSRTAGESEIPATEDIYQEAGLDIEEALSAPTEDRRPEVLQLMGPPDAFTLHWQELEGKQVRLEEWSYFDFRSRFDFVDGELLWVLDLDPAPDGSIYAHAFAPLIFDFGMSMAQVQQELSFLAMAKIPLDEADIPGGVLLAGEQILLGFDQDQLVFVQTFISSSGDAIGAVPPAPRRGRALPAGQITDPLVAADMVDLRRSSSGSVVGSGPQTDRIDSALPRGLFGRISKVVPFAGVAVGWGHRNKVYRNAEQFISDRKAYYNALRETARKQLVNRQIMGLRPSQVAAYTRVVAMIEQQRNTELAVAEARKRQARAEFHSRVEEALLYALAGSRMAQELIDALRNGVGSASQALERALAGTGFKDIDRIRQVAIQASYVGGAIGGDSGDRLREACNRLVKVIDRSQGELLSVVNPIRGELKSMNEVLDVLKKLGRSPSAGDVAEHMLARFLPGGKDGQNVSMEAIASLLSQLEVGDGSLKDAARAALNAGYLARCAAMAKAYREAVKALKNGSELSTAEAVAVCRAVKRTDLGAELLITTPSPQAGPSMTETPRVLPRVSARGEFAEAVAGMTNPDLPIGTTLVLNVDFAAGMVSGNLSGGRTTRNNPVQCVSSEDPSIVLDVAYVDYTDAYQTAFAGAIDPESGAFSAAITPKGGTTDHKARPYTLEGCLHLNNDPAPGSVSWTGEGTISGTVTREGYVEIATSWSSYGGAIQVGGNWSGIGMVTTP